MEESEENMTSEDVRKSDSPSVKKPKKRSLVERELETNLSKAWVPSSATAGDGASTSRYGRARRLKTEAELIETQKALLASIKSPDNENTPVKIQSPYRMHASNSSHNAETPKKEPAVSIDSQIDNIYQENISLSRFSEENGTPSPAKKFPKVYIRKDLIQNREEEEPIMLIKNLFSPTQSTSKTSNALLINNMTPSEKKYSAVQAGHVDNSSVVKTLDFDSKKKKDSKDNDKKPSLAKNELFEIEAKCPYQVGDLAWARMGTFPFWPCIITRDPYSDMFVKKKLFGRTEHDIIHVTFFGDNGRRSWIVDNMLRNYQGLLEFEATRDKFTPEDKKKDPRLYAAFYISEKKQSLWNTSVEEAETLLREPKRLRIDIFNDMLWKSRAAKKNPKGGKIMSRTNSDVSLSESLYDSLFSDQEVITDDAERSKNRSRNKSFDVSEVVTACLDNMAVKTGNIKIQRQSHMDRWLQKAKSSTPEKNQTKPGPLKSDKPEIKTEKCQAKPIVSPVKLNRKSNAKVPRPSVPTTAKPYKFRRTTESNSEVPQDQDLIPSETKTDSEAEENSNGKVSSITKTEDPNSVTDSAEINKIPSPDSSAIKPIKLNRKSTSKAIKCVAISPTVKPNKSRETESNFEVIQDKEASSEATSNLAPDNKSIAKIENSDSMNCNPTYNADKEKLADLERFTVKPVLKSRTKATKRSAPSLIAKPYKLRGIESNSEIIQNKEASSETKTDSNAENNSNGNVFSVIKTENSDSSSCNAIADKEKLDTPMCPIVTLAKLNRISSTKVTKSSVSSPTEKPYRFRRRNESNSKVAQEATTESKNDLKVEDTISSFTKAVNLNLAICDVTANADKEKLASKESSTVMTIDDDSNDAIQPKNKHFVQNTGKAIQNNSVSISVDVVRNESSIDKVEKYDDSAMSIDGDSSATSTETNKISHIKSPAMTATSEFIKGVNQIKSHTDDVVDVNVENLEIVHVEEFPKNTTNSKSVADKRSSSKEATFLSQDMKNNTENEVYANTDKDFLTVTDTNNETKNNSQLKDTKSINNITQPIHSVAQVSEATSVKNKVKSKNSDVIDIHLIKNQPIPTFREDSNMGVEAATNDIGGSPRDKIEESDLCKLVKNSVMEVGEDINFESQANGNTTQKSETVSSKNVEDNQVMLSCSDTDLKNTQNVTIEVSVTEKKNDDTLNNQMQEGQQESLDKRNSFQNTEAKDTDIFLDKCHSHIENMAENNDMMLQPTNNSTPEKYEAHEKKYINPSKKSTKNLNLECMTIDSNKTNNCYTAKKQNNTNKSSLTNVYKGNSVSSKEEINNEDITMDAHDDVLNESSQSESILRLCIDDSDTENHGNKLDTSFSESIKSVSILETAVDEKHKRVVSEIDSTTENLENDASVLLNPNNESTCGRFVESPTFTQLLDSEEFFRDISENHGSSTNSTDSKQSSKQKGIVKNDAENNIPVNKTNEYTEKVDEYSEETSDEEPSPEYESLDEEITEDFRKHMMSIESNIKDKKDEEQIVKICNEIAEKAKLSPAKYSTDEEVAKQNNQFSAHPKGVTMTNLRDKFDLEIRIKDKIDTSPQEKLDQCLENEMESKTNVTIKKKDKSNKHKKIETATHHVPDIQEESKFSRSKNNNNKIVTQNISETHEDNKNHNEKSILYMSRDATPNEVICVDDKPKIIYRTRRSIYNARRESPDLKLEPSKIEKYRRSAEYDPKVLLIRLEQDKIDCLKEKGKVKPLQKVISKNNKSSLSHKQDSTITKCTENVILKLEDDKSKNKKSRLSLRRDSPSTDNKKINNAHLEVKVEESTNSVQKLCKIEEIVTTNEKLTKIDIEKLNNKEIVELNNEPKKIDMKNVQSAAKISETVKVNGYHHSIDRKLTNTPESGDTDFDIDTVSLNSEDSEVSLPNSLDSVPKRRLRARPTEMTLENALKNPGFLAYLELKQDYLMDEHPELDEDEVIMYVYKTWRYEEDLKSDGKKIEDRQSNVVKGIKTQDTSSRSHKKKQSQPKNSIENYFREKYEKSRKTIDFTSVNGAGPAHSSDIKVSVEQKAPSMSPVQTDFEESVIKTEIPVKPNKESKSSDCIDHTLECYDKGSVEKDISKPMDADVLGAKFVKCEGTVTPKRSLRSKTLTLKSLEIGEIPNVGEKIVPEDTTERGIDADIESVDSEDSEIPLRHLRSKVLKENANGLCKRITPENKEEGVSVSKEPKNENIDAGRKNPVLNSEIKEDADETASTVSDNEPLAKQKKNKAIKNSMEDPEFLNYLHLKQDSLVEENPQLTQDEIVSYLYKTWLYEENSKSEMTKNVEMEQVQQSLVKGLNNNEVAPAKKVRRRPKVEKQTDDLEVIPKEKPRRRIAQPFYNENYSDIEDELEMFEIFKTKKSPVTVVSKSENDKDKAKNSTSKPVKEEAPEETPQTEVNEVKEMQTDTVENVGDVEYVDETEIYFTELTKPKPSVFKGLIREKVCDICEYAGHLVKCKSCNGTFHPDCVKREMELTAKEKEPALASVKGRKKRLKKPGRKTKSLEDSGSYSDEKHDTSADNVSMEDITVPEIAFDVETFESQMAAKMKEILDVADVNYDSYSSDDGIDWRDTVAGKCEIVDVKWKRRNAPVDYSDFKCNNCQKYDVPICFVCKCAVSKTGVKMRQKCNVAHCHKYYHLECLDHWPQTQFNSGEPSRNNKKISAFFETLTCPRHVCHTCVSDDPRGCKTRFSSDKLAKCVRCPATYHSFNKCLPAGSQVLTASHIICPRHCDQRPGKVPCHVNTGWCFICALGGSLICCEYCPTSFHAECLNIKPPEGNYMCEDCETGRLPLYGEMVWVKLGHYRWWPGIILHPSEIPDNIMAVKHEPGDFVVRFFGQYDHYWVNRGRVFPYQEGDSGRISSTKSKINEDFILAMEHAQRAYTILKNAEPDEEESLDIESSLLPPHYVKLKVNKPCGSLCGRKMEDPSLSLTQCECNPDEPDPCGPYSQCLNRMLLTECGPTCRAGDRCMNRAFEKRLYPKLVPYRAPHRGWGLKTLEDIKAGQFVIEYVGELIDEEEFRRRMRRKHEIRDENFYFLTLDKERMIDAGPKGNAARFMNHCCEPNCETQKWTVLGDVRVGLFAIDDIPANSEVTFNYNLECAGIEKKRCLCGAKRCSGYIGAKPKQDESQSKKGKEKLVAKRTHNKKKKTEETLSTSKNKPKRLGRPPKPKELTELEKDVLIIKNATGSNSSDESTTYPSIEDKNPKALKRKRVSIVTDEVTLCNGEEPCVKKQKYEEPCVKERKREEPWVRVQKCEEPWVKEQKSEEPSGVGD